MKKIKDYQEKDLINQPLMITSVLNGISNNGAPYLSLTLQDNSGSIEAKVWDVTEAQSNLATVGSIVEVEGDVLKYKGKLQARVRTIEKKNQEQYELSEFIMASDIAKSELESSIKHYVEMVANSTLRMIIDEMFNRKGTEFFVYPAAAKNHHDYIGGLATHTLEMCQIAEKICELFPQVNRDLLMTGVLLHDFGKIDEYVSPIVVEYSTPGKLLGHISMIAAEIFEIASAHNLENSEEVLLLRHMILSHHGRYEFGSPVLPQILEAELLSLIDDMDARIQMFTKHLGTINPGEFTQRIFPLENRMIYKTKLKANE